MRNLQKTLAFFSILAMAGFGQLMGCANDAENCELNYEKCPSTSTSSSSSSSGTVVPPGCEGLPSQTADVIKSDCAYFVGGPKANDSNTGGETDPLTSLATALDLAKKNKGRVYLCGTVNERVDIPAGVSIYGGFDCSADDWVYDAMQRGAIAPAAPVATDPFQSSARIMGSGTTNIEDIDIKAANATIDGGSSIALIVDSTTVNLSRVNLTTGNGKKGADGESLPDDPKLAGTPGNAGMDICTASTTNPGGNEVSRTCPDGSTSTGGKGGDGGTIDTANMNKELAGGDGANGLPNFGGGLKGLGEPETGTWSCASQGNGHFGETGSAGGRGDGAIGNGMISSTGYVGAMGANGLAGSPGQGGGGGGGARGKANICNAIRAGASGGSGGSGGCGGTGGGGGQGGGASIGIISLNASMTLTDSMVTAMDGGKGGIGGTGQTGGKGGNGAAGGTKTGSSSSACAGAAGGDGGNGGQGGGGAGGPSVGIAYSGKTPQLVGSSAINKGMAGAGGIGGDNNSAGNNGANGASETTLAF